MNVCLLNDSFPPVIDGVANTVINYASVLNGMNGVNVAVGTPEYPDADYSSYPYTVIPYSSYDTTSIVSGYRAGNPLAMKAINALTDFSPDIIHSHCPVASTVMARILRKETGAPIIFTYHTKFDVDIAAATKSKLLQKESIRAIASNISACDEVWTVSRGAGENLRSLGYEGVYIVMNNGVDFAKGRADDAAVAGTTAGYALPAGVPMFLFVGRIMKYKGLPLILEALRMLSEENIDYRMVFVGSGRDADELKATVREYGVTLYEKTENDILKTDGRHKSGAVIFTGPVYDRNALRAWNTRADLFLFPSTYDTNGIVVREAAACGLASVLIKDSCAAEGITDGQNGYIIDETPEAMLRLLKTVSAQLSDTARVGQNAMDEIYISWEDSVHTAYKRYEEVLRMKAAGDLDARRKGMSDHILDATAGFIDAYIHADKARHALYDSFRENMYGMKENFSEAAQMLSLEAEDMKQVLVRFEENIREEIEKAWEKQNSVRRTTFGAVKSAAKFGAGKTVGAVKTGAGAVNKAALVSSGAVSDTAKKGAKTVKDTAKKLLTGSDETSDE